MPGSNPIAWYNQHGRDLADKYEQMDFADIHNWLLYLLPVDPEGTVLDIGAGSGRDAAWLAERGHEVVAVEPSDALRKEGHRRHPHPRIRWVNDKLPSLDHIQRLGLHYDFILASAVWMHIKPNDRDRAFRKIVRLLKPGGRLALTLRHGPAPPERGMHEVHGDEIERLARAHGFRIDKREDHVADRGGRKGVSWTHISVSLPDDGTGALPLIRHIVLNDAKSSTYKLALLRTLCRIAEGADGLTDTRTDEDYARLPLGLVSLVWTRLFHPLIQGGYPQMPSNRDDRGPGFVHEPFRKLLRTSALDLRVGMRFTGDEAVNVHRALRDSRDTIVDQPAYYTTFPNGGPVFPTKKRRTRSNPREVVLDEAYLWHFGEMLVPIHLWHSLQRFTVWIEPALITEWARLMDEYATRAGNRLSPEKMALAMKWSDPTRSVADSRDRAIALMQEGMDLRCAWSNKRLTEKNLNIDHAFPWSSWPCDDLWNLLPTHKDVNHQKGARLPTARQFLDAEGRILAWWENGYAESNDEVIEQRFYREASATLPAIFDDHTPDLEVIFSAANIRRIRLKQDQQIPEWQS